MEAKREGSMGVLVPTYNQAQFINAALDSILAQSRPPFEVLVVNDGSTDRTKDVLRPYAHRVKIVDRPHRGVVATVQEGLALLRTDYGIIFNSDDIMSQICLEDLAKSLDDHPTVGVAYGGMRLIDEAGLSIPHPDWQYPVGLHHGVPELISRNYIPNSAAAFRMAAVRDLPQFGRQAYCEDWEMWISLGLAGWDFFGLPECLLQYRRHAHNLTHESRREAIWESEIVMLQQLLHENKNSIDAASRSAFVQSIGRRYTLLGQAALKDGRYDDARRLQRLAWKAYAFRMTCQGVQTLLKDRAQLWRT